MPAGSAWRVALLLVAGCGDPHFEEGVAHEERGQHAKAVEAYEDAIRAYPNHYEAARRIARIECYVRKEEEACRRWATRLEALEPNPESARRLVVEAEYLAARRRYEAGDLAGARRGLTEVTKRDPTHARAQALLRRIEVRPGTGTGTGTEGAGAPAGTEGAGAP